jgi:hypothetical protein
MAKKFPTPQEVNDQQPVAWRSSEDMIDIANKMNDWSYTNLCQTNKEWIVEYAIGLGWESVYFPIAYPSKTRSAGVVFIKE